MSEKKAALLVRLPVDSPALAVSAGNRLSSKLGMTLEPLFEVRAHDNDRAGVAIAGMAATDRWYLAHVSADGPNEWDVAHEMMHRAHGAGLADHTLPELIEPDLTQNWLWHGPDETSGLGLAAAPVCAFNDQNTNVPFRTGEFAWHLSDAFSQLASARVQAATSAAGKTIRIAHLDTGYDKNHQLMAQMKFAHPLERNFVDGDRPNNAQDLGAEGGLRNPGHGTGTLGILAGGAFRFKKSGYSFDGIIGGAPTTEIVPVRVGNSVVQLTTSAVARGINYAVELCQDEATRIHILSMSMGGVASAAWADAVNGAYEAGIIFVAAAGNNYSTSFGVFPTRHIVYPARFRRVLAACGVMADGSPYFGLPVGTMQGNWGPAGAMATVLSAFTPNTPWAQWGCSEIVRMDGAGTSSATPQIAAAAALYLQNYAADLFDDRKYPEPWMRVEAVRHALFQSAKSPSINAHREKLGNGILSAKAALAITPIAASALQKMALDSAGFPFLNLFSTTALAPSPLDAMLKLEATQLVQKWPLPDKPNPLEGAISDPDRRPSDISPREVETFLEGLVEHPLASRPLKNRAKELLVSMGRTSVQVPSAPETPITKAEPEVERAAKLDIPLPTCRKLRGFAVDPSLSSRLDTVNISEITFEVPWESLTPGPIGEYLEVVDVDPASKTFYEPIDLDHPAILAQDGLPPSEGIPQFHQQMVYAVSSLTIRNFEVALGRKALWRPGPPRPGASKKDDSHFVPRLRIYPHALREANAYYSPSKIALMFGYFDSVNVNEGVQLPGGRVFTCLSHDIVAHETTHALLDGMNRRLLSPSNPDVLAFHEGFADCVAMLQHFTFPKLVAEQIRMTRGKIAFEKNMLTQLALQFGFAIGQRTALRDATGSVKAGEWLRDKPNPLDYQTVLKPHDRGRILVSAVFDAFLSIYARRTGDLVRLATGGSGLLGKGEIHPDLVQRLAEEASKAAQHVLTMCIRALDYCPPNDITFGEYLRAIITADCDLVENDNLNYRVSFIEAFQRRGIYPPHVRTLSVSSLKWRRVEEEPFAPSNWLKGKISELRSLSTKTLFAKSRAEIFFQERNLRIKLHKSLTKYFSESGSDKKQDAQFLGINPTLPFEVHTARIVFRPRPDGGIRPQLLIAILQRTRKSIDADDASGPTMSFEGGCVIIADLYEGQMHYCIRKSPNSTTRLALQREFALQESSSLRSTYFGTRALDRFDGSVGDEPFALIHRDQSSSAL